jgi:shikimate kinase
MHGNDLANGAMAGGDRISASGVPGLRNVFLIGLMGAGKTTVGRHLARLLGFEFLDADHEIEARTGVAIPVIFEIEGEEGFRRREAAVIADLVTRNGVVMATGGGAVLRPENRTALRANGAVVYLRAGVDTLVARTKRANNRPLLNTADPRARLEELLRVREPLYLESADFVVETGRGGASAVAKTIMAQLKATPKPKQ